MHAREAVMSTTEITDLESDIETMLGSLSQLREENQMLRQRVAKLNLDRERHLKRNQDLSNKVRQIIAQIKEGMP